MEPPVKIIVVCPQCDRRLSAPSTAIGRILPCPHCGSNITVTPPPPPPRHVLQTPAPHEEKSRNSSVIYVVCIVLAIAVTLGVTYVLLDSDEGVDVVAESQPQTTVATVSNAEAPSAVATKESIESDDQSVDSENDPPGDGKMRLADGSDLGVEDVEKLTGRDWIGLNEVDRKAVVTMLAMVVVLSDQQLDLEGAYPIPTFLDDFYANAGNRETRIYAATDSYLAYARGIVLKAAGRGNLTTDAFSFDGDGYIMFQPKSGGGDATYLISVYDDATTDIVRANVIAHFGGKAAPEITRLRTPPGSFYLDVNSTVPWEVYVVNQRGVEWLKRTMNAQKNAPETE